MFLENENIVNYCITIENLAQNISTAIT